MNLGLDDRSVLITGASSGIGAALAVAYGRERARVAITYRTDRAGAERTAGAAEQAGGEAMIIPFDLRDADRGREVVAAVATRWGQVDVLVANAVQWPERSPDGRFEALEPTAITDALSSNIEGNLGLVQAVLPAMRATGWGRILFMSTGLADEGMPGSEVYGMTKAALHGFARSLAWGAGPDGILVNVLAAGLTLTERNLRAVPPQVRDAVSSRVPLRHLSAPEELATTALWLTSAANTSVTGEIVREGSSNGRSSHAM